MVVFSKYSFVELVDGAVALDAAVAQGRGNGGLEGGE